MMDPDPIAALRRQSRTLANDTTMVGLYRHDRAGGLAPLTPPPSGSPAAEELPPTDTLTRRAARRLER